MNTFPSKWVTAILAGAVVAAGGLSAVPSPASAAVPSAVAHVVRQVGLADPQGVPGAEVELLRQVEGAWQTVEMVVTDEAGDAQFSAALPPGTYTLYGEATINNLPLAGYLGEAAYPELAQTFMVTGPVSPPRQLPELKLSDLRGFASFKTRADGGTDLPARVSAHRRVVNGEEVSYVPAFDVVTNSAGAAIEGVPKGQYKFSAMVEGDENTKVWFGGATEDSATVVSFMPGVFVPIEILLDGGTLVATPVAITGTVAARKTLATSGGAFTPTATRTHQWRINGNDVEGQTGPTFVVPATAGGKTVSAQVHGVRAGYKRLEVESAAKRVPAVNRSAPALSGTFKVGKIVRTTAGQWYAAGYKFSYQWLLNGKVIRGATKTSLKLAGVHRGKKISMVVTAKKTGFATVKKASVAKKVA